ncbi:MAG TPA: hypothetical protein VG871_07200, partial [Vicinamibacterales bacterium]|nr:hypothetical protein [Vicinamibacterales bacterium]
MRRRSSFLLVLLVVLLCGPTLPARQHSLAAVAYTMRFPAPDTHRAEIDARIPTDGRSTLDLMLPVWSPGYYRVEDYAAKVSDFHAETPAHEALAVTKPGENHWVVTTGGAPFVDVSYSLACERQFVTGCWVGQDYAVINGPSTFVAPADHAVRPYDLRLDLPPAWTDSITSMIPTEGASNRYSAPNYDVFIDSPIVMGSIGTHEFTVCGAQHILADFGEPGAWNGAAAADALKRIVNEHCRLMGGLPFARYVFLNAFRRGAGGLEHLNSSLLSSTPNPT